MTEILKPCPFCGGEAEIHKFRRDNPDGSWTMFSTKPDSQYKWEYQIECTQCFIAIPKFMKTKKGAINKWNNRIEIGGADAE